MTELSATTSAFVNEVKFNWKINNLGVAFTASGDKELYSPDFPIGDSNCRLCLDKEIMITRIRGRQNTTAELITKCKELAVDGVRVDPDDYHFVLISVDLGKEYILSGGSLSIDMKGEKTITSTFGDTTGETGQRRQKIYFKNQTSKIAITGYVNYDYSNHLYNNDEIFCIGRHVGDDEIIFCIGRHVTEIEFKVKLNVVSKLSHEPVKDTGLAKLSEDMRAALSGSAGNSDFSIECVGKTFPCHEFILRARSSVLDAMFQNDMTEASSRSMAVVDVGPNTMAAVLEYMYTGGITVETDNMKDLIYIADKYSMDGLLEFCFQKLSKIDDDLMVDYLFMADKHNLVEYKKKAMIQIIMNKAKYMEDPEFMEKLKEVPHLLLELYKL